MSRQRIGAGVGTQARPGTTGSAAPGAVDGPALRPRADLRGTGRRADRRAARPHPAADSRGAAVVRAGGAGRGSYPRALRAPRRREAGRPRGGPPDAPAPVLSEGGVRSRGGAARPRRGRGGDRALPGGGSAPGRGPGRSTSCWPGPRGSAPSRRSRTGMRWPTPTRSATTWNGSRTRVSCLRRPSDAPDPDSVQAPEPATLAWRVLGTLDPPRVRCPRCHTRYVDRRRRAGAARLSALRDARHVGSAATGGVPGVAGGDRGLPGARAAWRPRSPALRGAPAPGPGAASRGRATGSGRPRSRRRCRSARVRADLLARSKHADTWALPRMGAALYRRQHAAGAPGLTPAEWRRIWAAYRARRPARPA